MKEIEHIEGKEFCVEFSSIEEFYDYLCNTPFNDAFKNATHHSIAETYKFTKTHSFDEAVNLMRNGWDDMAQELTKQLSAKKISVQHGTKTRSVYDVAGFQACVPRYLQGIPTNMINQRKMPVKDKVITINKSIGYPGNIKTDVIIEESVKALQIVKKLESQGFRVNLNLIHGTEHGGVRICTKIRVKKANERLNISKLAFCFVHPSMLRRLMFRFIEVYPKVTSGFVGGYGYVTSTKNLKFFCEGDFLIPSFVKQDVNDITDLEIFRA